MASGAEAAAEPIVPPQRAAPAETRPLVGATICRTSSGRVETSPRRDESSTTASGAALPAHTTNAYIQKVIAAVGCGRYERNHLNALTATFAPKLSHVLPPELVRRVVEYAFHVGDY